MSAPLEKFLSTESIAALEDAAVTAEILDGLREREVSSAPKRKPELEAVPPPPPAPLPVIPFPIPDAHLKQLRLERLKIDRVNVTPTMGEPCPTCAKTLKYNTVLYPGGMRPEGMPEAAWRCEWCRQYYVYREVPSATAPERRHAPLPAVQ